MNDKSIAFLIRITVAVKLLILSIVTGVPVDKFFKVALTLAG